MRSEKIRLLDLQNARGAMTLAIALAMTLATSRAHSVTDPQAGNASTFASKGPCQGVFPLPLAANWPPHDREGPTGPWWQIGQVAKGHYWLPTFWWGDFQEEWTLALEAYYRPALEEARRRRLPIALVATQWEHILYDRSPWRDADPTRSPLAFDKNGRPLGKLSPLAPLQPWKEAGAGWGGSPLIAALQEIYPDPPYVVLLSNNEAKKIGQAEAASIWPKEAPETRRRLLGDSYIDRYGAMVEALRSALSAWQSRAILVGWGGTNLQFGRTGWLERDLPNGGLPVSGRLNIAPFIWDGIAASFYIDGTVRRMSDDYTLFSPKVQLMNFPIEMDFACRQNPQYYWELTSWFHPDFAASVRLKDRMSLEERYQGFLRFGMWIARPRTVRVFNLRKDTLADRQPYLDSGTRVVDEIHGDQVLRSFWESSDLVANLDKRHPDSQHIPAEYADTPRWFLLNTTLDPAHPWRQDLALPIWAIARTQRTAAGRRWLLLVQAPLGSRSDFSVVVPELGEVPARATPRGCFYVVDSRKRMRSLDSNEPYCGSSGRE
jgi:hypothetical protein